MGYSDKNGMVWKGKSIFYNEGFIPNALFRMGKCAISHLSINKTQPNTYIFFCFICTCDIYSKYNHLIFFLWGFVKLVPLCNQCLHIMLYQMKLIQLSLKLGFYLSTLFSLCLDRRNNQIPFKTKPKHKEVSHPPPVWPKCHLWMPILKPNGVCIHILGCNLHLSDVLFV